MSLSAKATIFLSGVLFGIGLVISGMSNPAKVIGFLDITGNWDPSLALVMGGGLLVTLPAFHWILKRKHSLFEAGFQLPSAKDIDSKLLSGAALFGIGWGIAGFCPGPALTAILTFNPTVFLFVAAMVSGMAIHWVLFEK